MTEDEHDELHESSGHQAARESMHEVAMALFTRFDAITLANEEFENKNGMTMACMGCVSIDIVGSVMTNMLMRMPKGYREQAIKDLAALLENMEDIIEQVDMATTSEHEAGHA